MALFEKSGDVGFEDLVARPPKLPLTSTIPKIVHFAITEVYEFDWLNYAIVRSALDWLRAERVNIWVPVGEELPGPIWERVFKLQNVTRREMYVPDKVWGKTMIVPAHKSDVARMKILYEEGGIYMDHDLMALKPSDDVINDPKTRSAVLTGLNGESGGLIVNAMIMAKAQSPFLQRWMKRYKTFDPGEWDTTSGLVPKQMYYAGDPDLTLLQPAAWLYPEDHLREHRSWDTRQPYLTQTWIGKSWHDIDRSYGLHFWGFFAEGGTKRPFGVELSPDMVRNIDTPLFCRMRKLFDNTDGDGYFSTPWEKNPNCTVSWVKDLKRNTHRLFADYHFRDDTSDMKWVDTSGHRNHGWAFNMSTNAAETNGAKRRITQGSHAFLPVPADWDSRVGTVRMAFQPESSILSDRWNEIETGLLKIRMDYSGEIVLSLTSNALGLPQLKFEWIGALVGTNEEYKGIEDTSWTSAEGIPLSASEVSELAVVFDRRDTGQILLYLDGKPISNGTLPLVASPKIAGEVWFNAREWNKDLDTGFRGSLHRLSIYADAVPPQELARTLNSGASTDSNLGDTLHPSLVWIFVLGILLWLAAFLARRATASKYLRSFSQVYQGKAYQLLPSSS